MAFGWDELMQAQNSLDAASSELMRQVIREWFRDWTVVAITHDANSLQDYDLVINLENGRLSGYGPPPRG